MAAVSSVVSAVETLDRLLREYYGENIVFSRKGAYFNISPVGVVERIEIKYTVLNRPDIPNPITLLISAGGFRWVN